MLHFYAPWKHQKTSGFLTFSGGKKWNISVWNGKNKTMKGYSVYVKNDNIYVLKELCWYYVILRKKKKKNQQNCLGPVPNAAIFLKAER